MRSLLALVILSPLAYAEKPASKPAEAKPAEAHANFITESVTRGFDRIKKFLVSAAELMPPADYAFKPSPDVRSFGQIVAHVADASYMFCSKAKGEASPSKASVEKTMTNKADIVKALGAAFAFCDSVYAGTTDAMLSQPVELFGNKLSRFAALDINVAHDNEHYGNLVTYLRMKKLVPPSSAEK
jgi:uncharacterized damage-inducible protein DinB